ncbi:MAG TPA: serine/threonine-protein kinase, partial [Terriglobales bacterium]|nr:serine/threonine-protein kinase [Terriglobales bacterium]
MPLVTGTKLGPYEIVAPLGAGGMGEVYRARDTRLGRDVAIKILPQHLADNPGFRERFEREARSISNLSHSNICTLYDIGHEGDISYIVLEYLEGETLEKRLERGPLPSHQILKFAIQIADALAKAHQSGIVHRDLKPGNIMLTKSGAKLMDFGLARDTKESPIAAALTELTVEDRKLTADGSLIGTFQYMA